jgi:hypothetical protein
MKKAKGKVKSNRKIESKSSGKGKGKTKAKAKAKGKSKGKGKGKSRGKRGTQGKSKETTKKPAKKDVPEKKEQVDIVKVRESIANLVGASAELIATRVIEVAKSGQLAPAKYLFEMAGLYPATEETAAKPQGDSLAHTLLRRMGLPTEPGSCEERPAGMVSANNAGGTARGGEEQGLNAEAGEKVNAEFAESTQAECGQAEGKGKSSGRIP